MKTLILTEKPSVAMDFAKALGVKGKHDGFIENNEYIITWAVGHLVELLNPDEYDKKWKYWRMETLPIIPGEFHYKPISKTQKQLNIVCSLLKRSLDKVVIATDAGREGEVIARTILMFSDFKDKHKLKRFWTSQALTPHVVRQGMNSFQPGSEYDRLWRAGQSRQIADWLVGMNCTRAATIKSRKYGKAEKGKKNLFSVGRVQTAVLALIVDRRREIENFKPEPYWLIRALFINEKGEWQGNWFKKKQTRFDKKEDAERIFAKIQAKTGMITSLKKQKKKQPPPFLYSLTELQREANKKFGLSAKATLGIAQDLYEQKKCLSYPRTDSVVLGSQNVELARTLVENLMGVYPSVFLGVQYDLINEGNKRVFNDEKLTDHHALIPLAPLPLKAKANEEKIYNLVLKRFAAVFYPDFEFEQTDIITEVEKETFQTKGKRTLNPGWKAVYEDEKAKKSKKSEDEEAENLPPLAKGDPADVKDAKLEEKKTLAPPEYTEALLLKDMTNPGRYVSENDLKKIYRGDVGLGTQATRAQIIETLLTREYIIREKKKLKATGKGCQLIDTLRRFNNAKILASPEQTVRWEMQLEQIAQGKGSDIEFLNGIKQMVNNIIEEFKGNNAPLPPARCPDCGGNIIEGKKGYGCANWKEEKGGCKFVIWKLISGKNISMEMIKELLQNGKIGPFNDFISENGEAFSAVLKLVYNEKWEVQLDSSPVSEKIPLGKCPACGAEIIEGKKGYGCSNWREQDGGCKFVIWKNISGKLLNPQILKELLEQRETGVFNDFISKKGEAFSASLKLVHEDENWTVQFDNGKSEQEKPEPIGKCPECGGEVVEGNKGYGCTNWREEDSGCKFVIWKNIAEKQITREMAVELIEKGSIGPFKDFISKKGEPFSASLKMLQEEDQWKVKFDFDNSNGEIIGKCPDCGGEVADGSKAYGCRNWRDEDGGCKFVIWKTIAEKQITPEMAKDLIEKGKTGPFDDFISRKGKPFSASLKLVQEDEKWNAKFDFDDNPSDEGQNIPVGKCPDCGGDVKEGKRGYGCANWKETDGGCKFVIWKNISQKEVSRYTAETLLKKGVTDLLFGFISKKGNAFSAKLKIERGMDGQHKVIFDFSDM